MVATKRLVLDLPVEQADWIEAEVASGRYASPGAFVSARLTELVALPLEHEEMDWGPILAEIEEQERRIDSGEETCSPVEDVFARLRHHMHARDVAAE